MDRKFDLDCLMGVTMWVPAVVFEGCIFTRYHYALFIVYSDIDAEQARGHLNRALHEAQWVGEQLADASNDPPRMLADYPELVGSFRIGQELVRYKTEERVARLRDKQVAGAQA